MATRRTRGSAVFASIWMTIQGVVFLVCSIYGVMAYNCNLDVGKGNLAIYVLNLIYFHNAECKGTIDLSGLDSSIIMKNLTITKTPLTASRTYTWMTVYLVMSCLWIVTSLLLFLGAVFDAMRKTMYLTVTPWLLVTAATLAADVVATITYSADIKDTSTFQKLLILLNVNIPDGGGIVDVPEIINGIEASKTWIPSAVMAIYFSRCVFFWLVNLALLITVWVEAVKRNRLARAQRWDDKLPPSGPPSDYQQDFRGPVSDFYAAYRPGPAYQGREPDFRSEYQGREPDFRSEYQGREPDCRPAHYPAAPLGRPLSVDRLNSTYDTPASSVSDLYSLPLDPVTENWLARHNGGGSQDQNSTLNKVYDERIGPEELRGQLPWSYFQDRQSAPRPAGRSPPGERPPVPVPDYTLHFPKRRGDGDRGRKPVSSPYSVDS